MRDKLKFYRLSDATFYDLINTIYQFIKPFLDKKMSIFEEYGAFKAPITTAAQHIGLTFYVNYMLCKTLFPLKNKTKKKKSLECPLPQFCLTL